MHTKSHRGDAQWTAPVAIRIGKRPPEYICGPAEAIDLLEHRWPLNYGPHLDAAKRRCVEAMNHMAHIEVAREAFICAAAEAHVLK
ncbi:DUF982 domain-containing protein [Rhizobium sp. P32RR-XVIII]|uniref:DUF982 domain-containing protein n=1 Tax=Rhizobium sp. P32RR-XVIII TaxID=2726738 RepID=UPI0014574DD7|nr:DUF982 domain-containing protein [Rhizobium sp. P32RR-XVIII]NLS03598.1 DUF982 domain-containing protein [Rhizobium sp. P32RR-XVIII]